MSRATATATRPESIPTLTVAPDRHGVLGVRPTWRGRIHRVAVAVFVPCSLALAVVAGGGADRAAVLAYVAGVTAMLGVSARYHSGRLSPAAMRRMKRVDHSTILLAIAGSYTAVAVLALESAPAGRLLGFVWVAALAGVAVRLLWLHAPYPVVAAVYVLVGWGAVVEWGALSAALTGPQLLLLLTGGLLYTAGAGVYAAHRPNPWPATFGYHEVFHALVVAGVSAHFAAIASLVLQG